MRGGVTLRAFELPPTYSYITAHLGQAVLDNALAPVSDKAIVGFDMEWKPNHRAGQNNPTALVQIASLNAVVLVHIHHMMDPRDHKPGYVPRGLKYILSTTNVIKLGIGIREDFEKLKDDYPDVAPRNYVDLAVVAAAYGMSERGLKSMCGAFGHELQKPKKISTSNWEDDHLSDAQGHYAAQDAWASVWLCLRLFHRFARGDSMWEHAPPVPMRKLVAWIRPFVELATFQELVERAIDHPQLFGEEVHNTIERWQRKREQANRRGVRRYR